MSPVFLHNRGCGHSGQFVRDNKAASLPSTPKPSAMSSGIQALLRTEKEAAEIINEARKYRTNRLKSAKADAQKEIDEYKAQKESELKKYEQEHSGLNESISKEADAKVEKELAAIRSTYAKKKDAVVKLLVDATTQPTPELHINARS